MNAFYICYSKETCFDTKVLFHYLLSILMEIKSVFFSNHYFDHVISTENGPTHVRFSIKICLSNLTIISLKSPHKKFEIIISNLGIKIDISKKYLIIKLKFAYQIYPGFPKQDSFWDTVLKSISENKKLKLLTDLRSILKMI